MDIIYAAYHSGNRWLLPGAKLTRTNMADPVVFLAALRYNINNIGRFVLLLHVIIQEKEKRA